jgi:hypothetical protein
MKLIDLLVQELPKRGGWDENWVVVTQDADGYFCCWRYDDLKYNGFGWRHVTGEGLVEYWRTDNDVVLSCDSTASIVTRNQYESALAVSQKPAWNGEGVPPVGCECECHVDEGIIHCIVVGYDFDGKAVVMRNVPARKYFSIQANSGRIKPLRTESERKHEAALESICAVLEMVAQDYKRENEAKLIYEAIAAGKIPGVKLED